MSEDIQKWEYRVITIGSIWSGVKDEALEEMLNEWGAEGWEVVGFRTLENVNKATIITKRPLTRAARRERSMP